MIETKTNLIELINNTPTTTSLKVAEYFHKTHEVVLKAIRNLQAKSNAVYFDAVDYLDAKGEKRAMFRMDKTNFTLLAMGFTGKKAIDFKISYIQAFEAMEKQLQNVIPAKELSTLDILTLATKEIEKLQTQLTETQKTLEHKQDIIIDIASTVPPQTMRATINRVVRDYARTKQCLFPFVWNKLYTEFKYIYNIDLKTRAKHQNKTPIQVAEEIGELPNFYKLSLKMFEI